MTGSKLFLAFWLFCVPERRLNESAHEEKNSVIIKHKYITCAEYVNLIRERKYLHYSALHEVNVGKLILTLKKKKGRRKKNLPLKGPKGLLLAAFTTARVIL